METSFNGKNPSALTKMYTISLHSYKGLNEEIRESTRMPSSLLFGFDVVNKNKNKIGERQGCCINSFLL